VKKSLLTLLFLAAFCTCVFAESSVWRAQKGKAVIYLGGTCHVLRDSDFPLPPEFEKAYRASDIVVFETDIGKLQDPVSQQAMMYQAIYSDGTTVADHLSPQTYQRLKTYCEANGFPLSVLGQLKPSMLMVTLTMMELMKMGVTQQGVDKYFYDLAKQDHKKIAGLETVDQQIEFLLAMSDGDEDQFVNYSLNDMKTIKEKYQALADAWRKGETVKLDHLMISDMKERQPKLYKRLITDRNREWLREIEQYDKTPQKRFVLVGVGHLVGSEGLLETLRKRGYRIDQL
jgi:uncharacterized protein